MSRRKFFAIVAFLPFLKPISKQKIGKPISRQKALQISQGILAKAEWERRMYGNVIYGGNNILD